MDNEYAYKMETETVFGTPKLNTAIAATNAMLTNPKRDREVTVRSDKGNYKFSYATYPTVLDVVRGAMSQNGLSLQGEVSADAKWFIATLRHSSGEEIKTRLPWSLPTTATIKDVGSAITYRMRYIYGLMFPIAGDDDDDGSAETGDSITTAPPRTAQPPVRSGGSVNAKPFRVDRPHPDRSNPEPPTILDRNAAMRRLWGIAKPLGLSLTVGEGTQQKSAILIPDELSGTIEALGIEFFYLQGSERPHFIVRDRSDQEMVQLAGIYGEYQTFVDAGTALGPVAAQSPQRPQAES